MLTTFLDSSSYQYSLFSLPPLLIGLAIFLLGLATLMGERGTTVSRLFFLMTSAVGLWLVSIAFVYAATDENIARGWVVLEHVGVCFIPATLFHLAVSAMHTYQRYRKWVWIGWTISFLFALVTATTDLFVSGLYRYSWGYYPRYSTANVVFLVFFSLMLWAGLRQYWHVYRTAGQGTTQYRRARAFLIAFGLGYLASVDYLPAYGVAIYPLGFIPILAFLLCSARAIRRYHLVDITPAFAANEIIQTMGEAVLVLDQEGIVRLANAAAGKLFQLPADVLVGRPASTVLEGAVLPGPREIEQRGGIIRMRETFYRAPSGDAKTLSISASTMQDGARGVVATICVIRDISDRKAAEERVQHEAARSQALLRVASRLNAQLDVDAVLHAICEETARALSVPIATVSLYDRHREEFYLAASHGLPQTLADHLVPVPASQQYHNATQNGSVVVVPDIQTLSDLPNRQVWAELDIYTAVAAHMWREKELVGRLNIGTIGGQRHFTGDELQLLQGLADQAAQATANARLYEQAQRRLSHLQALRAIDSAIMSNPTLDLTLQVTLRQIVSQLQVDAADILLLDPQQQVLELAALEGFYASDVSLRLPLQGSLAGRAALEQRIVAVADLRQQPDAGRRKGLLAREGFVAYYAVPLASKGQVKGVLEILHRTSLAPDPEWLNFMETLAGQAALAIDNATLLMETKRLLEQIRLHAQQVQQIIDTVPDGLMLLDQSRRVILANPAAADYLGLLGVQVDAQHPSSAVLPGLAGQPVETFLVPAPQGATAHQIAVGGKEGRTFEVIARPMQSNTGEEGLVLVLRDVTLERQITERAQQQGRLAAVGQLAAGIAHDFNNIMMVISLYVQMIERSSNLTNKQRDRLNTIRQQAMHATNLIQQILDFSRRSVLARRPMELLPFLEDFLKLLRRALPENIRVDFASEPGDYVVKADETRLQQILMNLAVNARDAMPEGGVLSISLSSCTVEPEAAAPLPEMEPGQWLLLSVSDNGSGIPGNLLPRLFEPFFTTKEPGRGTGLGLAQVYGIVRQHDGHIAVQSQVGEGTTFTIYLPVAMLSAQEEDGEAPLPVARGSETVLLVEDDDAAREAIHSILETHGYRVLTAANGRQALELFGQSGADLVLSDMVMPEMGGVGLFQALKQQQPDVKMILLTGYPLEDEGQALLQNGIVSWLPKPVSMAQIVSKVRDALDGSPLPMS